MADEETIIEETPQEKPAWQKHLKVFASLIGGAALCMFLISERGAPPTIGEGSGEVKTAPELAAASGGQQTRANIGKPQSTKPAGKGEDLFHLNNAPATEAEKETPMSKLADALVAKDVALLMRDPRDNGQRQRQRQTDSGYSQETESKLRDAQAQKAQLVAFKERAQKCKDTLISSHFKDTECAKEFGYDPQTGRMDPTKNLASIISGVNGESAPPSSSSGATASYPTETAPKDGTYLVKPGTNLTVTLEENTSSVAVAPVKLRVIKAILDTEGKYVLIPIGTEFTGEPIQGQNIDDIIDPRQAFKITWMYRPGAKGAMHTADLVPVGPDGLRGIEANVHWPWKAWGIGLFASVITSTPSYFLSGVGGGFGDPLTASANGLVNNIRGTGSMFANRFIQANPTKDTEGPVQLLIKTANPMYLTPYAPVDKTEYEAIR